MPNVAVAHGQMTLFVTCEVCRTSVNYHDLSYAVGRDRWACPACYAVWYQ